MATDQLQQESGKTEHGQASVPDLGTVVPTPFPFFLGVELHFGGQFSRCVETHFRPLQAAGHQIRQPLNEGGVGI